MHTKLLLCLCAVFGLTVAQFSNTEVSEYVTGIETVQEDALNYDFPNNSNSYKEHADIYEDCKDGGTYDFIIVGAGSAGTVLANRLTEVLKWKVLLLEAGTWENMFTDIPGIADYFRASSYNWGYNSYPQRPLFKGYLNNSLQTPRGKGLGGSSIINAMIYARGNKDDYDKWASLGNPGWSFEEVLPYFKKSENATFPNSSSEYHGHEGPLHVEYSRVVDQVGHAFLDAQVELGREILDYNGQDQMGFDILQMSEINGRRDSGGKAFLDPIRNRKNLHISDESLVLKIEIDDSNTANGVKYIRNNTVYYAKACKEVILSAGTLQTPQILMLSGIGPRNHLERMGIPVKKSLPVGKNLWDHLIFNMQGFSMNYSINNGNLTTQVEEYGVARGPLTSPDNVQVVGYVNVFDGTSTVPNIEHVLHTSKSSPQPYELYKQLHRYTEETYEYVSKPNDGISQWSVHWVLLHEKSRGEVRLKSASPFDFPVVDPNYFSDSADIDTMVQGWRDIQRIANTSAMQKYNSTAIKIVHPVCEHHVYDTDPFWRCMIVHLSDTVHHFGGTCRMGPELDDRTVVNPRLKVHGVKKLRVVDCSVIPVTLSGHTNAPAFMIGEKAADIIKEDNMFPCSSCNKCSAQ